VENVKPSKNLSLSQELSSNDDSIDKSVLQNMRNFAKLNALKRAALGLMAFSLAPAEMDNLEKEFRKLDKSGTGTIKIA
jgi:hypothetical protein